MTLEEAKSLTPGDLIKDIFLSPPRYGIVVYVEEELIYGLIATNCSNTLIGMKYFDLSNLCIESCYYRLSEIVVVNKVEP